MRRAVLWDLDGTLVDSGELDWRAWRETMAGEGVTITREQFLASFGQRNDVILAQWLGGDRSRERIRRIGEEKEERYRDRVRRGALVPLSGAAEWLQCLRQGGWRQAIASSAPRRNIEVVLEQLRFTPYFEAIVAAEDVERGKPDPEVFLVAASRAGVPPSRCVVVEDSAAGIEAARRAGMRSIGLARTGVPFVADVVAPSLAALPPDAFSRLVSDA